MKLNHIKCLVGYGLKKPAKLWRYFKFGYVCGTEICVNDQFKVVYVVNPKVASTSILEMLSGVNREQLQRDGVDISEIRKRLKTKPLTSKAQLKNLQDRGYLVFTFVRNPYERAVSFYKNKFVRQEETSFLKPVLFAEKCGFESCKNFTDVLDRVIETPASIGDAHFISQYDVLFGKTNDFQFDFIGKIEAFDQDYALLQERIVGLPKVKKLNATHKAKESVDDYFLPDQKKRFSEKFKKDFEFFGYES